MEWDYSDHEMKRVTPGSYHQGPWPEWGDFIQGFETELMHPPHASFTVWTELIPEMREEITQRLDPWSKNQLSRTCHTCYAKWHGPAFTHLRKLEKLLVRYGTFRLMVLYLWEKRDRVSARGGVHKVALELMARVIENNRSEGDWIIFKFLVNMIHSYSDFYKENIEDAITSCVLNALPKGASPATFQWFWPRAVESKFTNQTDDLFRIITLYRNAAKHGNQRLLEYLKTEERLNELSLRELTIVHQLRFALLSNFLQSKPKYWTDINTLFNVSPGWHEVIIQNRDHDLPEDYNYSLSRFIQSAFDEKHYLRDRGYKMIFHLNQLLPYLGNSIKARIWSNDRLRSKFLSVARAQEDKDVFTLLHDMGVPRMFDELAPYPIGHLARLVTTNPNPPCLTWFMHTGKLYDLEDYNQYGIGSEVAIMMKNPYFRKDNFKNLKAFRQWIIDHPTLNSDRVLSMFDAVVAFNRDLDRPLVWSTLADFGDSTLSFDSLTII